MVAKYYSKSVSIQKLRELTQVGSEGANLLGISEAAETIGFRTHATKVSFDTLLEEVPLPAILHWNQNHFVVLYQVKKGRAIIADPSKGLVSYENKEIQSAWVSDRSNVDEGICLILHPAPGFYESDTEDEEVQQQLSLNKFTNYLKPYNSLFLHLFIGLGLSSLLQLVLPFLTRSIVDVGINTKNIQFIYIILFAQLALLAGRLVIEYIRSWILLHISSRVNISLLTDFMTKLLNLPLSFFTGKKTGDIMQRINDHARIQSFLTSSSINILFSLLNFVLFSFILAYFQLTIFFVFVSASIVYAFWIALFLKKRKHLDYKRFDVAAREQSTTIQLIHGIQEIKLNGAERPMRWHWESLQAKFFKLNVKGLSLNQWQQTGAFLINEGKNIVITFLSAYAVINNEMTLGTMLAVQYIAGQLNGPIEQMIGFVQGWQNAKISIDRLNEIHGLQNEEAHVNTLPQPVPSNFTITLRNLSYTYPGAGNSPIFTNLNLTIPEGKVTAIVGHSGSGKTTLLKLLLKFYDPQEGEIYVDKTPLITVKHSDWRKHCGVVMQDSYIFSDTIANNIAVGVERIDLKRLQEAVSIANILEFIQGLPLGLNTKIGSEGVGLSMGQKQRILIARAVYRNPDLILLDEATNSLDANNESMILKRLESFFDGRTVIIIAHRLSTIFKADQIVVMHRGTISEFGTHEELIMNRGHYFDLIQNQLELNA